VFAEVGEIASRPADVECIALFRDERHGRRKHFFPGREHWGFFQNFSRGTKVVKFVFSRAKVKKTFLLKISKSRRP